MPTRHQPTVLPSSRRQFLQSITAAAAIATTARAADEPPASTAAKAKPGRHPLLFTEHRAIAQLREAALEVLKPTPAQLEHGLELHYNSLVFDTYGFAPRAALDSKRVAAAREAGASALELQDLNEDMGMTRAVIDPNERAEFAEAMRTSGVTCIFQNSGEEGSDPLRLIKRLARFTYLSDMLRETLVRATLPDDIEAAKAAGKHCLYMTGNGVPLRQQWVSDQDELAYVRIFFQLGIRMMHLTYNRRNALGDGCGESSNGGISELGRAAIAEMNRVGVIVDVAHSGWKTSLEAAQASKRPMVASHTTCDALNHHIRAKPDEVIRAICDTGGLVGICCIPTFLGGSGDLNRLLDHIDYVTTKFGAEHVGIGTDIAHKSQYEGTEKVAMPPAAKTRPHFESLWPQGSLGGVWPKADSLRWTNWPLYTVGLVQRGYSDADIQKIIGGNMLRVCRAVLRD